MLFNSFSFLIFAAIFFPIYHLTKKKLRIYVTLLFSYIFYGMFDYRFLILIFIITIINFSFGNLINKTKQKKYLIIALSLNLGILGYFKYFNFFIESFYDFFQIFGFYNKTSIFEIALPVGISFFTFQGMSYIIDIYKKDFVPEKNFFKFATYIALFPQLVAGPIVRAKKIIKFIGANTSLTFINFLKSFELIIYGFFLKLCVADRLAIFTEQTFSRPSDFGGGIHLISSIFFSFQIYADFAGYSLIAIGLGKMMCLRFGVNFRRPYFAENFQEFWRRWHISLSSWLRDYIYIPLGGNKNKNKIFINIIIVMGLGGLWHGASYNFILWGFFHGILLCLHRFFKEKNLINIPKILKILSTFLVINLLWIFFRSETLKESLFIFKKIFYFNDYFLNFSFDLFNLVIGTIVIIIFLLVDLYFEIFFKRKKHKLFYRIPFSILTLWIIIFIGIFEGTNFIYFKF